MESVKTVNKQIVRHASFAKINLGLVGLEGSNNHALQGNAQEWEKPNQVSQHNNNIMKSTLHIELTVNSQSNITFLNKNNTEGTFLLDICIQYAVRFPCAT